MIPLEESPAIEPVVQEEEPRRRECKPSFFKVACKCNFRIVRSGCMRKTCPECRPQVGKRRAGRVRQRLEAGRLTASGKKKAMIYTIVTVPPHLRDRFRDKKEWRRVVRSFWKILHSHFGGKFALECSHPIGDESPDFHPHANFLWIQRDGYRPFLAVKDLRKAWAMCLETYSVVDVWTSYTEAKNEKQEIHRLRYTTRVMDDPEGWVGSMRWFGDYPKIDYKEEPAECTKCHSLFVFLGVATLEDYLLQESEVNST